MVAAVTAFDGVSLLWASRSKGDGRPPRRRRVVWADPGPAELARLVATVAEAVELTVLPGGGTAARAERHAAAVRASAAADGRRGSDARGRTWPRSGRCAAVDRPAPRSDLEERNQHESRQSGAMTAVKAAPEKPMSFITPPPPAEAEAGG